MNLKKATIADIVKFAHSMGCDVSFEIVPRKEAKKDFTVTYTANPDHPLQVQDKPSSIQSKGGIARAKALSPRQRKNCARKAAKARWDKLCPNWKCLICGCSGFSKPTAHGCMGSIKAWKRLR